MSTSIFMKDSYIFQYNKKQWWLELHCFILLQISSMSCLIHESWSLTTAHTFDLLPDIILVEALYRNLVPHKYMVRKGRSILIPLLNSYEYSSLILYQNLTSQIFSKVSLVWNLEHYQCTLHCYTKIHWSVLCFKAFFAHMWFYHIMH